MRYASILGTLLIALSLQGCAAIGLSLATAGAGAGISAGYEHTVNGIVYKTFAASKDELRIATLEALKRMAMPVTLDQKSEAGWALTATANKRTIDIELQALTEQTTRMRVVANDGTIFFKDASTATEIINQTAQAVVDDQNAAKAAAQHKKKVPS
jgi:hypothetical protein